MPECVHKNLKIQDIYILYKEAAVMDKNESSAGTDGGSGLAEGAATQAEKKDNGPKRRHRVLRIVLAVFCAAAVCCVIVFAVMYGGFHPLVKAEMGTDLPDASVFVKSGSGAQYVSDVSAIDLSREGTYLVTVSAGGKSRSCVLSVRDTIAPTASASEINITIDEQITPDKLVKNIKDNGPVTVSWSKKPKFGRAGDYDAAVVLKDEGKNKTKIHADVHIRAVLDSLTYEIGDERPEVGDFLLVKRDGAEFSSGMDSVDWNVPGSYDLSISVDGKNYPAQLIVADTVAPELELRSAVAKPGRKFDPNNLVVSCKDKTDVELSFSGEPDTSVPGEYEVTVTATDLGGNKTQGKAVVIVSEYVAEVEAREYYLNAYEVQRAFGKNEYVSKLRERFRPDSVGLFAVHAKVSTGDEVCVAVNVTDTVPPKGEPAAPECCAGYRHDASEFVDKVTDITDVTASFLEEPDWDAEGEHVAVIVLTDEGGNETEVESPFVIVKDTVAPSIYNVRNRYFYVDEPVAYFKEVSAGDNADPDPELTVDSSYVNMHKEGEYPVIYKAVDADGNEAFKVAVYTFEKQKVTDEELDKLADEVLSEIFYDGMTIEQQAYAIFNYVYSHIRYLHGSDKTDWKSEAYRGITEGKGDCFTFYSTSYLLLSKIDCQVMSVERYRGATQHFWLFVNTGTGWYHFDACNAGPDHYRAFMKTNSQVQYIGSNYWRYDHSLYPELATEKYPEVTLNPPKPDESAGK